jgi:predicted outer membrane repeat protein
MGDRGLGRSLVRVAALVGLVTAPLMVVVVAAGPAAASTTHVSTETDFRNAWNSNANDTIVLDADIHLSSGGGGRAVRDAGVDGPITVDGQGKFTIFQEQSGNGVLGVQSNSNVTLRGVTLTGAKAAGEGGGIRFRGSGSAQWTMDHVTFANNATGDGNDGGAIQIVSGTGGTLTVTDSTFANNHAGEDGGAISCNQLGGSVAINVTGSTFVGNSTRANSNSQGGAINLDDDCSLTMVNSTVTGNTSADFGAISGEHDTDHITLVYTDVVNNTFTPITGGLATAPAPGGSTDSAGSSADPAGGVSAQVLANSPANVFLDDPTKLTVFASVITGPHGGPNCAGSGGAPMSGITSNGFNFADDTSCGLTASTDKQASGNDPGLGPLANNGGPTQTLLPQTGSPLIDAIVNSACQTAPVATGITTDQRSLVRPQVPGGLCDIGAVEIQATPAPPPAPVVITPKFTG